MNKLKAAVFALMIVACVLHVSEAFPQRTTVYTHEDANFKTGLELFKKQKYGSAQRIFQKVIESHPSYSLVRIDAEYYAALCAIELFNKDGELLLKSFIKDHPESPRVKTAYFYLGKYNYRKKKWEDVIRWLDKVDIYELSKPELSELYFKRGYAYFELGQMDKAKKDLYEIKDVDTKYSAPANYYYSHIAYLEKNYETALQGFTRLVGNPSFGPVVPYYIAQIYYLQGKYEDVITYAPPLLDSAGTKRAPEIARIIGESYYRTSKFKEAIPYLKKYEAGRGMYPQDHYQLAYAYYRTGDCDNAIAYFKNTVSGSPQDTLAQNAYYHLGDCFIKKGNKDEARNAFRAASRIDVDKQVKEDALYNYAKLSYELAYNPFSEAIDAFQEYIKLYPSSPRVDEAYGFLVNVYLTTKNYKDALTSIEKIKTLNEQLKTAYQKIAYFRGAELFNSSLPDYDEAIRSFDKSLKYRSDKTLAALAIYWKGESYYRKAEKHNREYNAYKKDFLEEAVDNYTAFQAEPGAFNLPEYNIANYNIGYVYFQLAASASGEQQKTLYREANIWFRKYITSRGKDSKDKKLADVYVRTGDTYFMIKDFQGAEQSYTSAIELKVRDVDYALYQRAQAYGLQQKRDEKIADLRTLSAQYPKSNYALAGRFEMAKTLQIVGQSEQALEEFEKLIKENPNSVFTSKAMMQIGLIYYEKRDMQKALDQFVKVIKRDNRSEEAKTAFITGTNIAKSTGNTEQIEMLASLMGQTVSSAFLDSVAFESAKKLYFDSDCDRALPSLENYITKFPQGFFIIEANFFKAECSYGKGDMDAALAAYSFVTSKSSSSKYLEPAYLKSSVINFKKKNYGDAAANYARLEEIATKPENVMNARIGLMHSYYQLKTHDKAIEYANKVIADEKTDKGIANEARFIIAHSSLATEKYEQALNEFAKVSGALGNEMGAESKFYVAYIRYLQNDFNESKKITFELIKQFQSYPYWMAKGLILLADNYVALNDNFQARHTLKSVIENSKFPELVKEAQQKLDAIISKENEQMQKLKPSEDIKIEFNESRLEYQHLFTEPSEMTEPVKGGQQ
jgi:TolA-binding protein